jgi:CubicO group peptidase (beta-lactamase class C family)
MAAAGGYVAGAVAEPGKDLGVAYDTAMQALVFDPMGMSETTFDMARAQSGNFASSHDRDFDGVVRVASIYPEYQLVPYRPAGGAWSSAHDMIKYVGDELTQGVLPNGKRLVLSKNLLMRRARTVQMNETSYYGMVNHRYEVRCDGDPPRRRHCRLHQRRCDSPGCPSRRGHPD